jgi:hypothetical protein
MKTLILTRKKTGDSGTFGEMTFPDGTAVKTGELPCKDNQNDISCVPPSDDGYVCKWEWSPKRLCYKYCLQDVPDRIMIQIHSGNFCGDVNLGYQSDVQGCILLGANLGKLMTTHLKENKMQDAVVTSVPTVKAFEKLMNSEDFLLIIKEDF